MTTKNLTHHPPELHLEGCRPRHSNGKFPRRAVRSMRRRLQHAASSRRRRDDDEEDPNSAQGVKRARDESDDEDKDTGNMDKAEDENENDDDEEEEEEEEEEEDDFAFPMTQACGQTPVERQYKGPQILREVDESTYSAHQKACLKTLVSSMLCSLCGDLFLDPVTLASCSHTFCRHSTDLT